MNSVVNFIDDYTKNSVPKKVADVVGGDKFDKTETIEDDNGKEITIPKDFGVAEDSNTVVDEGIVITDGTNEFVWVPVDNTSTMFIEETETLTGVETTTNIYSNLRVMDGDGEAGKPGASNGVREPDVLSGYDTNSRFYKETLGFNSTKEMADSMVAEYKAMSESVKKYHGFYIGRYELTGTLENPTVKSGNSLKAIPRNGDFWYGLYKACQNVIKDNTDVKSTMIYGCQWDETISWLNKNGYNTDTDSSSWGNYSGHREDTGSDTRYKANEIFDLAGNYGEWTQETTLTSVRVIRGGTYDSDKTVFPAASRLRRYPDDFISYFSTRCVLYIM